MSCNSSDPAGPRAAGGRTRLRGNPPGSVARRPRESVRPPALPRPSPGPPPALPGPGRGAGRSPPPHGRPVAVAPPGGGNCGPCPSSARELRARWGLAGGRAAVRTSLLKVFTASMLSAQRPGARRRKRRRPARRVRKGGRRTQEAAEHGGQATLLSAGEAPAWPRGGRSEQDGGRRGGSAAGEGPARAPSLLLRPARQRPRCSGSGRLHSPPLSPPSSSSRGLSCGRAAA